MTSIQDAWGVSDLGAVSQENPFSVPEVQKEHLSSHMVPASTSSIASSIASHPNSIVETRPTRMDVALYCPKVIEELFPKSQETRTNIVTDLIRAAFLKPKAKKPEQVKKEYFEVSEEETQTDNMTVLMLLTFVLILIDKLFNIWKNS